MAQSSSSSNIGDYYRDYFEKAQKCLDQLRERLPETRILTAQGALAEQESYFVAAQIFNTRLQFNPLAIVLVRNTDEVAVTYKTAIANHIPVRVRGGGHDHEGDSTGTNVVLIDLSQIDHMLIDKAAGIARIGAGNRFNKLTTDLANEDVMIAHGTCATVCVSGNSAIAST